MKINITSSKLAFVLIALLVIHIIFSAIIPQIEIAENQIVDLKEFLGDYYIIIEKLALDRIYYAPPFFVLLGLLALNLIWGNVKRFKLVYKTEKTLLKTRHIGSIIFHLSLIIIMLGIILNFLHKSESVFSLTEGQTVMDNESSYFRNFKGPLSTGDINQFKLKLDKIDTEYKIENATTNAAQISIWPSEISNPITTEIYTNHPYSWQDMEFHYGLFTGYSPEIVLLNKDSLPIFRAFVRLAILKSEGQTLHTDYIIIEQENLRIELKIIPNNENQLEFSQLNINVVKDIEQLYIGDIKLNETVEFDDYILTFPRLRNWCYISVIKSPFLNLIFFGFWSALFGLTVGLVSRVWRNKNI